MYDKPMSKNPLQAADVADWLTRNFDKAPESRWESGDFTVIADTTPDRVTVRLTIRDHARKDPGGKGLFLGYRYFAACRVGSTWEVAAE